MTEVQGTNTTPTPPQSPRSSRPSFDTSKITNGIKSIGHKSKQLTIGLVTVAMLGVGFLGGWLGAQTYNHESSTITKTQREVITSEGKLISDIAKSVGEGVVSVNVTTQTTSNDIFGFGQPLQQEGAGTGFIISEDGIIVTNRHVVPQGVTKVSVTTSDGTEYNNVAVIGRTNSGDPLDIAFLKIKDKITKKLSPVTLGDSSKMQVGEKVIAIGNALGQFQNTVTSGIISGHGRNLQAGDGGGSTESLQDLFQTDAAINQGNSGGPLVNLNGEVIGINTAVAGGNAQNIGFAIPINDVKGIIQSVLDSGKLLRPYLGVRYITLTDDYAAQQKLTVKRGAYIAPSSSQTQPSVVSGSPAEKAGIKEGDIITKVNDVAINETNSLTSVLGGYKVGETVTLTIIRDGKTTTVKVNLEAAPN